MIGQYHAKSLESLFSGCIRRYGVILYHKMTGIAVTINAMLLPSPFTTRLSHPLMLPGASSCEAKVYPGLLVARCGEKAIFWHYVIRDRFHHVSRDDGRMRGGQDEAITY